MPSSSLIHESNSGDLAFCVLANKGRSVFGLAEGVIQIELACMFVKVFLLGMKTEKSICAQVICSGVLSPFSRV